MDTLTPSFFSVGASLTKGIYHDCSPKWPNTLMDKYASNYLSDSVGLILDSRQTHVLPFGRVCHNFGHWHRNVLPSIFIARKYFPQSLIVVPKLKDWQKNR